MTANETKGKMKMTLIPEQSAFIIRGENTRAAQGWIAGELMAKSFTEQPATASRRVRRQSRRSRYL